MRSRNHLIEIVAALKQEEIPFRAVEIDSLGQRQEVLDLTALTRALLHPADRVAALAVLRAPWCGLSLADLHTLTGCDDPALQGHSIQRLMDERGHLLPDDSCQRLARVWSVLQFAAAQRARLTPAQLVERAWRSLGGDTWLTQSELMNTNRFFQLLNELQVELEENRPVNLLDPTLLESRLQELYAEPNPTPEGTPFVELLTIHKAKGLEWDVVLVPALERQPAGDRSRLLTWSELEPLNASDEDAAHFMLAPIAGRGEPSKALNNWLNGIHRAREAAERKRLFYVACTRARQELHLFAAPQLTSNGEIHPHSTSLLQAAWPAAEAHFFPTENLGAPDGVPGERSLLAGVARLDSETWVRATNLRVFNPTDVLDLAASASPTLERLPLAFDPAARIAAARAHRLSYGDSDGATASGKAQFSRPEGSFAARSFGNVVHAVLETLAGRIAAGSSPAALLAELPAWTPRLAALLRADGLAHTTVNRLAREARTALEDTLRDPDGLWLLAPHAAAASEFALTAWPESHNADGQPAIRPTSIRVDRIFRAGAEPHSPGEDFLWIVNYKTSAHGASGLDDFLAAQRAAYAPQLETYARILTQLPHPANRPAPKDVPGSPSTTPRCPDCSGGRSPESTTGDTRKIVFRVPVATRYHFSYAPRRTNRPQAARSGGALRWLRAGPPRDLDAAPLAATALLRCRRLPRLRARDLLRRLEADGPAHGQLRALDLGGWRRIACCRSHPGPCRPDAHAAMARRSSRCFSTAIWAMASGPSCSRSCCRTSSLRACCA